jgi:hypothetical protein
LLGGSVLPLSRHCPIIRSPTTSVGCDCLFQNSGDTDV